MSMANQVVPRTPQSQSVSAAFKRMTLDAVKKGRVERPMRVLLYGPEGIGKSTFGANAPSPIFLGAEDGTDSLDAAKLPEPHSWQDVLDGVRLLTNEEHPYKTLVLDTLDWLEPLCWRHVCAAGKKDDIEAFGYGKGYVAALDQWRVLIAALEVMRKAKPIHVVLLAHSHIKSFKNPSGEDYDRFTLKLNEKAGGLLKEWCDAVLFANYETHVVLKEDAPRAKAYADGTRVLHTERRAAWDAKNRFGLPERMILDWPEFYSAARLNADGPEAVAALRVEIESGMACIADEGKRATVAKWLATPDLSADALRVGLNKVTGILNSNSAQVTT